MIDHQVIEEMLLALLDGSTFANAVRRNGKPGRIRLPDSDAARRALIRAHAEGAPATLTFGADGYKPWQEHDDVVILAAYCPAADGRCRWLAIDLDSSSGHGRFGLINPSRGARFLAERASDVGLAEGLLVATSRSGTGRHVWLIPPEPVPLADAALALAHLAARAYAVAFQDVVDGGVEHAFAAGSGSIADPGAAGAVEFIPRGTERPPYGWSLTLPAAGAYAASGGGRIVDPLRDRPVPLATAPRCDTRAWEHLLQDACLSVRTSPPIRQTQLSRRILSMPRTSDSLTRANRRARAFVEGRVEAGSRNQEAFAAACALFRAGAAEHEVTLLIRRGAELCGLPDREVRSVVQSAIRAVERRP